LLTSAEARERIGVSREQLRRLILAGEIEAIKTGDAPNSHFRISEEAIAAYIESHKVVPAGVPS
jgi:excisionase family DNA binding protein